MKKSIVLLAALLIGGAVSVGERREIGFPAWIADYHSLDLHGTGAPINWAAFTDAKYGAAGRRFVPSGTAVSLSGGKIVPADGSADTLLMMSDARESSGADSISGYGLATAGNIHENMLPDAVSGSLPGAVRSKATRFYFQSLTTGATAPAAGGDTSGALANGQTLTAADGQGVNVDIPAGTTSTVVVNGA